MPLLSFLDENRGEVFVNMFAIVTCLVNVLVFPFKVHRRSASFF